jgi:xanthine/uracil/vitamin C permease (AzgA family)
MLGVGAEAAGVVAAAVLVVVGVMVVGAVVVVARGSVEEATAAFYCLVSSKSDG